jgi:hypothetical protein
MRRGGKSYYYDHGGKPRRWESLGPDLAAALKRWAVIRGASSTDRTVTTLVDAYMARYAKDLAENTLRNYQRQAATIKRVFGDGPVSAITTKHLQKSTGTAIALEHSWTYSTSPLLSGHP